MIKNKKTLLIIFLIIAVILGIVLALFSTPEQQRIPQPSSLFSPTPSLTLNPNLQALTIRTIKPLTGNVEIGGTTTAISVTFSQPINKNTVMVTINPSLPFTTSIRRDDFTRLIIIPSQPWQSKINYEVVIAKGLTSTDGSLQLKEDTVINYQVELYNPEKDMHDGPV